MKNRRSKIIIRPDVQYSFVKFLIAFWMITFSMSMVFVSLILTSIPSENGQFSLLNWVFYNFKNYQDILIPSFLAMLGMIVAFGYYFFRSFTTKICGPIYNMQCRLKEYNSGAKDVRIKIRKNDFYHDLQDDINQLFDER